MARGKVTGKGTQDFNAYVRNLQRAMRLNTVGAQLKLRPTAGNRSAMVYNPYSATIADMSICDARSAASVDGKKPRPRHAGERDAHYYECRRS